MAQNYDDQSSIRRYLLHQFTGEEQEQIEQRLLTDDELFDQVQAAEDELVDQCLSGALTKQETEMFEKYFLVTPERQQKVRFAKAFQRYVATHPSEQSQRTSSQPQKLTERPSTYWRWPSVFSGSPLRTAVVAALILTAGLGVWRIFFSQSDVDKGLLALNSAYRDQRPLEARITQFNYAPFGVTRGGGSDNVNEGELRRAELTLLDSLNKKPTAAAHHALGKVYLAKKDFDRGIVQFEQALTLDANNAQIYADLGAALLEKGKRYLGNADSHQTSSESNIGKGLENLGLSLEALNKALALNDNLLEALFNRALCHQYIKLPRQAIHDWQEYLKKDSTSRWASEARHNLQLLEHADEPRTSNEVLKDFMEAFGRRDDEQAWRILSQTREMITNTMIPFQLAQTIVFVKPGAQGENVAASLAAFEYAGQLERKQDQDTFVAELASYYSALSKAQTSLVAEGHRERGAGYELCLKSEYEEALNRFSRSRSKFEEALGVPDTQLTQYWIAYCYARMGRISESSQLLEAMGKSCRERNYRWLLVQALTLLGSNTVLQREYSRAEALNLRALDLARDIADTYLQQKILGQLTELYQQLADPERALQSISQALSLSDLYFVSTRQMWRNYAQAAEILYELRMFHAAVAYGQEELHLATSSLNDEAIKHDAYLDLGRLYGGTKDYSQAIGFTQTSLQIAESLGNDAASQSMSAYTRLQLGHLFREAKDYRSALEHYDRALSFFEPEKVTGSSLNYYETRKGRLLCYAALDDEWAASQELPVVLDLFEQHRSKILEEQNRNTFFDKEQSVYDLAIAQAFLGNHQEQAFAYSEASRARSLLDMIHKHANLKVSEADTDVVYSAVAEPIQLTDLRSRMPADVQIVQYSVLPEKLVVWVISRNRFEARERSISSTDLSSRIQKVVLSLTKPGAGRNEAQQDLEALYEFLITPIESLLDPRQFICLVPDKMLNQLPFAALIEPKTGEYLIAKYTLLYAPSASVFVLCTDAAKAATPTRSETLVSFGDPEFDHQAYPELPNLPGAAREVKAISSFYPQSSYFIGSAANRKTFLRESAQADVIHFAGHYLVDQRWPLRSQLLLADGDPHQNNKGLSINEVVTHRFHRAHLLVLSACRTLLDRYYNGEGAVGIARIFLGAGVPLIVASQWPVDSEATADLMIAFHRHRKEDGLRVASALRQAQLDMLHSPEERYRQPYYWAAFASLGGVEIIQPTKKESNDDPRPQ